MTKTNKSSPSNNLSVQLYNGNGTERIVIKNDTLHLDNTFGIEYHRMFKDIGWS
jgi:hypothetical protein